MKKYRKFIFDSYDFDRKVGTLSLKYSYDDELFFTETVEFPLNRTLGDEEIRVLDRVFKYLHLAAGVSYYKLFAPWEMELRNTRLDGEEAEFFNDFYRDGLGEFSYRNNLTDLRSRINFPHSRGEGEGSRTDFKLKNRVLIPIGGGKDSLVTLEIVRKYTDNLLLCSVGRAKPIVDTVKISGCDYFSIGRTISPVLLELNGKLEQIGGYNGHVPISGIISLILVAAGVIVGFDTILMSNERSASVGNVDFNGITVNHQWSKSFEFEEKMNSFIKEHIFGGFNYLSFLRPLSEIHIVKLFAGLKQYHGVFASCNGNFRIENKTERWCCDCPKCRFVFLALAVYLDKSSMMAIFGRNILDEERQLDGFLELCGIKNHRPFECVGEIEESIYAVLNVHRSFGDDYIVRELCGLLAGVDIDSLGKKLFTPSDEHLLTDELRHILYCAVGDE